MTSLELKRKREALGLSQKDLASLIGVGKNTIYNYESGGKIPDSKIPILNKVLDPNISTGKEVAQQKESASGFEDVVARKVLERFKPIIEKILESHQQSKNALDHSRLDIDELKDEIEELKEKINLLIAMEKEVLDKVSGN